MNSLDSPRAKAKFRLLGMIVATSGALACFERTGENLFDFLRRHVEGDWGDLCPEDKEENELSVDNELRILSAYHLKDGTKRTEKLRRFGSSFFQATADAFGKFSH